MPGKRKAPRLTVTDDQIDLTFLSGFPLGLGCAGTICLVVCVVCGVFGGLLAWAAADERRESREFLDNGSLVEVEVTGKSKSPIDRHRKAPQFWLEVGPTDSAGPSSSRLAVSRQEYDQANLGDRLQVWRLGNVYKLDRVVRNPLSPTLSRVFLAISAGFLLVTVIFAATVVTRMRRGPLRPDASGR